MKKNHSSPDPARKAPAPDRAAERADRADRRTRSALADGREGPDARRIVTAPREDLRGLDLRREWVAPGKARSRRMRRRRILSLALAAVLVLAALSAVLYVAGRALGWLPPPPTGTPSPTAGVTATGAASPSDGPTATPGADATPTPAGLPADERAALFASIQADLSSRLAAMPAGRYAIYYENLANGETWGLHAGDPFVAASSIKMGIDTYLYSQVKTGMVALDEMLSFDKRAYPTGDLEYGTGTIQNEPDGTQHSVRETARLSIRISDNCAINMILRRLGGIDAVNAAYLGTVGGTVGYRTRVEYVDYKGATKSGRARISADTLGKLAVDLYGRWSDDPETYGPLMDDLAHTSFDYSIPNLLPKEVVVAHKIGTNSAYYTENDVGIVFAAEPFVVVVTTESGSIAKAHAFTAEVAKALYDYVQTAATGVAPG